MLTQEQKDQWVTALRSGEYVQGRGWLRTPSDKFCCLGVLCDILPEVQWEKEGKNWLAVVTRYPKGNSYFFLPFRLNELITMEEENTLIDLADSGVSFTEIADWIEENIHGV